MGSPECLTYFQQEKTNHEQITKTKDLCLSGWKKLGNHQGIQEEIQPLSQSDYQSLSSEIPSWDDCLDLSRWIKTWILRNRFERDSEIRIDCHDWEKSLNEWKKTSNGDSKTSLQEFSNARNQFRPDEKNEIEVFMLIFA